MTTTSVFPAALDNDVNLIRCVETDPVVPALFNNLNDAIQAIEGALGVGLANCRGGVSEHFVAIEGSVLDVDTAAFTFNAIPGVYQHLQLVMRVKSSDAVGPTNECGLCLQFNGDETSGDYHSYCDGRGDGAPTSLGCADVITTFGGGGGFWSTVLVDIPYYSEAGAYYKTVHCRSNAWIYGSGQHECQGGGVWKPAVNAPISSITVFLNDGDLAAGSHLFLYGITG